MEQSKFWGITNISAASFSRSNFPFKRFTESILDKMGILQFTTALDILIFLHAEAQGDSVTSNDFLISPPKNLNSL